MDEVSIEPYPVSSHHYSWKRLSDTWTLTRKEHSIFLPVENHCHRPKTNSFTFVNHASAHWRSGPEDIDGATASVKSRDKNLRFSNLTLPLYDWALKSCLWTPQTILDARDSPEEVQAALRMSLNLCWGCRHSTRFGCRVTKTPSNPKTLYSHTSHKMPQGAWSWAFSKCTEHI